MFLLRFSEVVKRKRLKVSRRQTFTREPLSNYSTEEEYYPCE